VTKKIFEPTTMFFPMPTAVISVGTLEVANLITLAWVGTVASTPAAIGISIRPSRYSYDILNETGEFVVNIPDVSHIRIVDYCGTRSGRDEDKWEVLNLTKGKPVKTQVPLLEEFPINIECKVIKTEDLGSHRRYIGKVLAIHANEDVLSDGKVDPLKLNPILYSFRKYFELKNAPLEKEGYSTNEK